jgi:hypothetical protein
MIISAHLTNSTENIYLKGSLKTGIIGDFNNSADKALESSNLYQKQFC